MEISSTDASILGFYCDARQERCGDSHFQSRASAPPLGKCLRDCVRVVGHSEAIHMSEKSPFRTCGSRPRAAAPTVARPASPFTGRLSSRPIHQGSCPERAARRASDGLQGLRLRTAVRRRRLVHILHDLGACRLRSFEVRINIVDEYCQALSFVPRWIRTTSFFTDCGSRSTVV